MEAGRDRGREGAGIRPRVTNVVMVLYIQLQLYCANAELSLPNAERAQGG